MRQKLCCVIGVLVTLALAAISTRYVHPHWSLSIVYSLQLHVAATCILASLLMLLLARDWLAPVLLAISLALAGHAVVMSHEYGVRSAEADAAAPTFQLLSINALNTNIESGERIARMIVSSGADLVNVMEAPPLRAHIDELMKTYPYRIGCGVMIDTCDHILLSKLPIEMPQMASLSEIFRQRFILGRVRIAGRPVYVANIHTTKPYFDNFHSLELRNAAGVLNGQTDGPLVLSGDFNASTLAPDMRHFLDITGLRGAGWEPATWPIEAGFLGLPVDHVYVRAPLKIKSLDRLPEAYGSNHYGLIAEIAITGQ